MPDEVGMSDVDKLRAFITAQKRIIALQDEMLSEALLILKPFAALGDICDHFNRAPDRTICNWKIGGVQESGPTARECRAARDFLKVAQTSRAR